MASDCDMSESDQNLKERTEEEDGDFQVQEGSVELPKSRSPTSSTADG